MPIAKALGVNIKTIQKWKHRENTKDLPRPKVATALLPSVTQSITDLCRNQWTMSTRKIAKILNASDGFASGWLHISRSSVLNFLHPTDWDKIAYKPIVKPLLSEKNTTDRIRFCNMVTAAGYTTHDAIAGRLLDHLVFSDESVVELFPKPNSQNTRIRTSNPGSRTPIQLPKHGLKIMVAGALCANGLSELHIVEKGATVTGEYYRSRILPTYMDLVKIDYQNSNRPQDSIPLFEHPYMVTFMQDGAPAHTALATLSVLGRQFQETWSKNIWPGN
jgi:hypothetical protein